MSKRGQEDVAGDGSFWKKMRMGATAAVAVGTGVYALANTLKRQGLVSNIIDDVKTAVVHSVPQLAAEATNVSKPMQPSDIEEARAVLQVQMRHAFDRQDKDRVQELAHQLDQLDSGLPQGYTDVPTMQSGMQQMPPPETSPAGAQMPHETWEVRR